MFIQLRYAAGFFLLFFVSAIWAEIAVPPFSHRVTDLTATLSAEQSAALENKLAAFEAKKGSQIAVLILPTTQSEDIAAFGIRVAESWKIGRKTINDGVILIVAKNDRTMRIEVGRGLEGAIPDAIAKRILAETIKPYFKTNDYAGGINAGVNQLISLIEGEKLPEVQAEKISVWAGVAFILTLLVLVVTFFVFLIRSFCGGLSPISTGKAHKTAVTTTAVSELMTTEAAAIVVTVAAIQVVIIVAVMQAAAVVILVAEAPPTHGKKIC